MIIIMPSATPPPIITTQFAHLHPLYCVTNPPITGPITGPFIGPILHMENAVARYLSLMTSPTVPGALAIIAAPNTAPKNLVTMMAWMFLASAQGRMRITNRAIEYVYTGFLPYVSDIGARSKDPTASPKRYVVTPSVVIVSEVMLNSLLMSAKVAV